jgi:hypothetical protein
MSTNSCKRSMCCTVRYLLEAWLLFVLLYVINVTTNKLYASTFFDLCRSSSDYFKT